MINKEMVAKIIPSTVDGDYIIRAYGIDVGSRMMTPDGRVVSVIAFDGVNFKLAVGGAEAIYPLTAIALSLKRGKLVPEK